MPREVNEYIPVYEKIETLLKLVNSNAVVGKLTFDSAVYQAIDKLQKIFKTLSDVGWVRKEALATAINPLYASLDKQLKQLIAHPNISEQLKPLLQQLHLTLKELKNYSDVFMKRQDVSAIATYDALQEFIASHPEFYNIKKEKITDIERSEQMKTPFSYVRHDFLRLVTAARGEVVSPGLLKQLLSFNMLKEILPNISETSPYQEIAIDYLYKLAQNYVRTIDDVLYQEIQDKLQQLQQMGAISNQTATTLFNTLPKMKETLMRLPEIFAYSGMEWSDRFVRDMFLSLFNKHNIKLSPKEAQPILDVFTAYAKDIYHYASTSIQRFASPFSKEQALASFFTSVLDEARRMDRARVDFSGFVKFFDDLESFLKAGKTVPEALAMIKSNKKRYGVKEQDLAMYVALINKAFDKTKKTLAKELTKNVKFYENFLQTTAAALPGKKAEEFKKALKMHIATLKEATKDEAQLIKLTSETLASVGTKEVASTVVGNLSEQRWGRDILDLTMAALSVAMTFQIFSSRIASTAEKFRNLEASLESFGLRLADIEAYSKQYIEALSNYVMRFGKMPHIDEWLAEILDKKRLMEYFSSGMLGGRVSLENILNKLSFSSIIQTEAQRISTTFNEIITTGDNFSKFLSFTLLRPLIDVANALPPLKVALGVFASSLTSLFSGLAISSQMILGGTALVNFMYTLAEKTGNSVLSGLTQGLTANIISFLSKFKSILSLFSNKVFLGVVGLVIGLASILSLINSKLKRNHLLALEKEKLTVDALMRSIDEAFKMAGDIQEVRKALQQFYTSLSQIQQYRYQYTPTSQILREIGNELKSSGVFKEINKTYQEQIQRMQHLKPYQTFAKTLPFVGGGGGILGGLAGGFMLGGPWGAIAGGLAGGLLGYLGGKLGKTALKAHVYERLKNDSERLKEIIDLYNTIQPNPTSLDEVKDSLNAVNQLLAKPLPEETKAKLRLLQSYFNELIKTLTTHKYKYIDATKTIAGVITHMRTLSNAFTATLYDTNLAQGINSAISTIENYKKLMEALAEVADTITDAAKREEFNTQAKDVLKRLNFSKVWEDYNTALYASIQRRINAVANFFKQFSGVFLAGVGDFLSEVYKLYNKAETRKLMAKRYHLSGSVHQVADLLLSDRIVAMLRIKARQKRDEIAREVRSVMDYEINKRIQAFNQYANFTPIFSIFQRGISLLLTNLTAEGKYQFSLYASVMRKLMNTEYGKIIYMNTMMKKAIMENNPILFATSVLINDINKAVAQLPNKINGSDFLKAMLSTMALEETGKITANQIASSFKEAFEDNDGEWKTAVETYKQMQQELIDNLNNITDSIRNFNSEFSETNNQLLTLGKYKDGIHAINQEFSSFVPEANSVKNVISQLSKAFDELKRKSEEVFGTEKKNGIITTITTFFSNVFSGISQWLRNVSTTIKTWLKKIGNQQLPLQFPNSNNKTCPAFTPYFPFNPFSSSSPNSNSNYTPTIALNQETINQLSEAIVSAILGENVTKLSQP